MYHENKTCNDDMLLLMWNEKSSFLSNACSDLNLNIDIDINKPVHMR